ncbi:MAG: hypothetical protein CL916_04265 [Deltaproteobacteria bacterium]|nr:hypothetical protein [Deltaproteobacteria bacterium]
MKLISLLFFILSYGAWYVQQHPSSETWNITFIEWNQKSPVSIWSIFLTLGVILFLRKSKKNPTTPSRSSRPQPKPRTQTQPRAQSEPKAPIFDESVASEWKEKLSSSALSLTFPRGGKIAFDPQKDTPFVLKLPHKTHQAYKDSIHIFAQWLCDTPTPKRVMIRFDAGCSEKEQQLVRAAFRKHYHINEMIIRKEANQIDILFHHPDQKWGIKYNLNKTF